MPSPIHQVVAMTLVYRRIAIVILTPVFLILLSPVVLWSAGRILYYTAGEHSALCLGMTLFLTLLLRYQIHCLASSPAALEKAQRKNRVRFPALSFLISCVFVNNFGSRFPTPDILRTILQDALLARPLLALRVAISAFILGALLTLRFVGRVGISKLMLRCCIDLFKVAADSNVARIIVNLPVRCSVSPFIEYSVSESFESILKPSLPFTQSKKRQDNQSVRQSPVPTIKPLLAHVGLSFIAGLLVYSMIFVGDNTLHDDLTAWMLTCVSATMTSLYPLFDGLSHEIDPHKYIHRFDVKKEKKTRVIGLFAMKASIPVTLSIMLSGTGRERGNAFDLLALCSKLFTISALMLLYLERLEYAIRMSLFNPTANLRQLLEELQVDTNPVTMLGIILRSLIGCSSLVEKIWVPVQQPGLGGPERDEIDLSTTLFDSMATNVLRQHDLKLEAPFEEDILRITVLRWLDGRPVDYTKDLSIHKAMENHDWMTCTTSHGTIDELSIPLVRGLCVFIGGSGEALKLCSSPTGNSANTSWILPPAFFSCLDFATTTLAQCILQSLTPSGRILCDWKSSKLSNHVPVSIKALHSLRTGIMKYSVYIAQNQMADAPPKTFSYNQIPENRIPSSLGRREHWEMVRKCDSSASIILHSAKSLSCHGRLDLLLDEACIEWKNELMTRSVSPQ